MKKHETIIQWLSGLGFPLALVLSSWLVSSSIQNAKNNSDYVKLAISILNSDLGKGDNGEWRALRSEEKAMRGWAIRVIDEKSPIKLSKEEKLAFIKEGVAFQLFQDFHAQKAVEPNKDYENIKVEIERLNAKINEIRGTKEKAD